MNRTRHRTATAIAALALTLLATLLGLAGATPAPAGAQAAPAAEPIHWTQISTGRTHACAVSDDGAAWCWGDGTDGRLGNGDDASSNVPVPVTTPTGVEWASISAGDAHTCALTTEGDAWCWGSDAEGQLGDRTFPEEPGFSELPVAVDQIPVFTQISAGRGSCALDVDGNAWCWGTAERGALGAGSLITTTQHSPILVDLPGVHLTSIDVGSLTACGVTETGAGHCWGSDQKGIRGDGVGGGVEGPDAYTPVPIQTPITETDPVTWARVDLGDEHGCGTTAAGDGFCWGENFGGRLGIGYSGAPQGTPYPVVNPDDEEPLTWGRIVAGRAASCGLTTAGVALCWGGTAYGEVGNEDTVSGEGVPSPVATDDVATWSDIDLGHGFGCGISTEGAAWCWGLGTQGQLGIGALPAGTFQDVVREPVAVVTAPPVPTTVALTASPMTAGDGDEITFTATASGDDTDGSFELAIAAGGPSGPVRTEQADSQAGTATWVIDDLGVGAYSAQVSYRGDGGQVVATSGTVAIRVLTPAEEAVANAYRAVLGREPDPAGLAFWVEQLGTRSPAAVADALAKSKEGRARLVTLTYESVLGYRPGTASRDYWVAELLAGRTTPERLVAELYGTIATAPVDALYRIHLGRTPSTADRTYWGPKVDTPAERKQSSLGTGRLPEALTVLVRRATTAACGEGAAAPTGAALTAATDLARATAGDVVRVTARLAATHCPTT